VCVCIHLPAKENNNKSTKTQKKKKTL